MASFAAAPDPTRDRLYAGLTRRNRLVGVLRVGVPVGGALVLAVVIGGIVLDNLRTQFGFSSLHIDRDNLVVDTPKVTSINDAGTLYSATAKVAKMRLGTTDIVDMNEAVFTMTPVAGAAFTAATPIAALSTTNQTLTAPGLVAVSSDDGLHGTLTDLFADVLNWQMRAEGAVDLSFPGGTRVQSQGMSYNGDTKLWTFTQATVTIEETPGVADETTTPEVTP